MSRPSRSRLATLVGLLPYARVLADIGAGDLDLARLALARGRAARVIAVDRAPGACARARLRARTDARIEVREGDGFSPLKAGEAEVAVLAGLGGKTLARILERAALGVPAALPPTLVLAPNQDLWLALAALARSGYTLRRWALVAEGARLRPLLHAVRPPQGGGGEAAEGGELMRTRLVSGEALRAAFLSERAQVLGRELEGADGERADALRCWLEEVEGAL